MEQGGYIVGYDGRKYITVNRPAKDGELVILTHATYPFDKEGMIFPVHNCEGLKSMCYVYAEDHPSYNDRSSLVRKDVPKFKWRYDGWTYLVLEPIKTIDAEKTNDCVLNLRLSQKEALIDFIEVELFRAIREDENIDNIEWVADIIDIYKQLKK